MAPKAETSDAVLLQVRRQVKWKAEAWRVAGHVVARVALECAVSRNGGEPWSFHSGGIVLGMMDGSSRFVRQSIDIRQYARMITAQGGEVITDN